MKTSLIALAVSLSSALVAAPVPKEKPAPFDPSGVWVTESVSDLGDPFEVDGHDFSHSRFEINMSKKTAVLTLHRSGQTATYSLSNIKREEKTCRCEGVSSEKSVYMRRFRVLCKREGQTLWLAVVPKYSPDDPEDWPSSFTSGNDRQKRDAEAEFVLKLKRVKK